MFDLTTLLGLAGAFLFLSYQTFRFSAAQHPDDLVAIEGAFFRGDYEAARFRRGPRHRIRLREYPAWFYVTSDLKPDSVSTLLTGGADNPVKVEIHRADLPRLQQGGNIVTYGLWINGRRIQETQAEIREKKQIKWLWMPGSAALMGIAFLYQLFRLDKSGSQSQRS